MNPFLPISKEDMKERGWDQLDFVLVSADAYVDHPSFGAAIIARVLESQGFRVGVLAQPDWRREESFLALGKPRLAFLVSGGNIDSMVAHYTAAKRRRSEDEYSPGGKAGYRPDRPTIVYTRQLKKLFPSVPVIIGGLEASLRRFAHYDYWDDAVRPSVLADAGADLLSYGMGENQTIQIARRLAAGEPVSALTDIRGPAICPTRRRPSRGLYPARRLKRWRRIRKPMPGRSKSSMRSMTRFTARLSSKNTASAIWCRTRPCRR